MKAHDRPQKSSSVDQGTPKPSTVFQCFLLVEASLAHLHNNTLEILDLQELVEAV
jgi:hypothetical protein